MADGPITFDDIDALPELVVSLGSMEHNHTGSWRYLRPVYDNKVPPCSHGCPAANDIEGFVRLAAEGRYTDAWLRLKEENPLTRVCGRVCFHPCEAACNRRELDVAVSINALERFVGEHADRARLPGPVRDRTGKRVAVVGSGPAGLSAAWFLARLGHEVVVFEKMPEAGGLLRYGIPRHRLPREVLDAELDDLRALGVELRCGAELGGPRGLAYGALAGFDAVFVAIGAHRSRPLGVAGEDGPGVMPALALLGAVNAGDAVAVGARAAVIGGGNSAIDAARVLVRLGAQVDLYYRRGRAEMPAFADEVAEAVREGVTLHMLVAPVRIERDARGVVTGVAMVRMELGEPDASGRRRPRPVPGSEHVVATDTVVTAVGEVVDAGALPPGIDASADGSVAVDDAGRVGARRLWAGGDVTPSERTVVTAIGAGKRAAIAIDRELMGAGDGAAIQVGRGGGVSFSRYAGAGAAHGAYTDRERVVAFSDLNTAYFDRAERARQPHAPVEARVAGFDEVVRGLSEDQARAEAGRCFHCGVCTSCDNCYVYCPDVAITVTGRATEGAGYRILYDYCKGCGICVAECPRASMTMVEEA